MDLKNMPEKKKMTKLLNKFNNNLRFIFTSVHLNRNTIKNSSYFASNNRQGFEKNVREKEMAKICYKCIVLKN